MKNKTNEELLKLIEQLFFKKYNASQNIKELLEKKENLNYEDAHQYAIEVGELLSDSFIETIDPSKLPNQTLFYDIGMDLLYPTMKKNHDLICDYSSKVQKQLNEKANIHLKVQCPSLNEDRIRGIVYRLDKEKYEDIQWILQDPIVNACQSVVDDMIKENVEWHAKSGLHPIIVRKVHGGCCKWCMNLAGTYKYPNDVPDDIYRRHRDCRCVVIYDPKDGRGIQDVHSKLWEKDKDGVSKRISIEQEELLKAEKRKTKRKDLKQSSNFESEFDKLKRITYEEAYKRGYNPLPADKVVPHLQKESNEWFKKLIDIEKEYIERYTFNTPNNDKLKLYEKVNQFLVGYYKPKGSYEQQLIMKMADSIHEALLKFKLEEDIIVYRNDDYKILPNMWIGKFLSTSVTKNGTLKKTPNMSVIVPKGTVGAYIGDHSLFPKQREFLLDGRNKLEKIAEVDGKIIYEVKK